MSTGVKHKVLVEISVATEGDDERRSVRDCRCMKGQDHDSEDLMITQFDPSEDEHEEDQEGEPLSVYEAADIWRSRGEDGDYMFGYGDDELRQAADED